MAKSSPPGPGSPKPLRAASPSLPLAPRRTLPGHRRPTRHTALSVEAIVAAAVEVLDDTGVAGLSMRRVAERLGTGPASLYAHVSGREELVELVFDELVGQVPPLAPDPERWREQVHRMMGDLRQILASHRDAALAGLGRVPTSPRALAAAECLVAVLRAGGLSDRTVALGFDQLVLYVSACAFEAGALRQAGMSGADVERYFAEVHAFFAGLPPERFPVLASIAVEMTGHDGKVRFQFGLDCLLDGLEAADGRERRSGGPRG